MTGSTAAEIRQRIESIWARADREGDWNKDSMSASNELAKEIRRLDPPAREVAADVVVDWIVGDSERKRYDAMVLIDEFRFHQAIPTLKLRLEQLETARGPSVPYDREAITRLIAWLDEPAG
jgi:hypothetical protein